MANESTGTGLAELDQALDGLYWGDNVVWVWEGSEASSQRLFYDAIAQRREDFGRTGYVVASSDPAEVKARWPWIEIIDAQVHMNQLGANWRTTPVDSVIATGIEAMDAVGIDHRHRQHSGIGDRS